MHYVVALWCTNGTHAGGSGAGGVLWLMPAQFAFVFSIMIMCSLQKLSLLLHQNKKPFGYVGVLQEEDVEPSDGQRNVLNQLRDWDLWCV